MSQNDNLGWMTVERLPPPPSSPLEVAQTEKPIDAKVLLADLLHVAARAKYAMSSAIATLESAKIGTVGHDLRDAYNELAAQCETIQAALGPRVHQLKTDPQPFALVKAGLKKYEVRKFDRPYRVGDELRLLEHDRGTGAYSGAWIRAKITSITKPGDYGLPKDVGVLGIEVVDSGGT